ncbi:MAG: histone deacetylase [Pseudomonadota bacterium]
MSNTIVLKDQRYLNHETRYGHPESPKRLEAIYEMLQGDDIKNIFEEVMPRKATKDEIELNHSIEYVERIERTANKGFISLDPDTNTSDGSWEAAALAAGAVLTGVDLILEKKAENGFALVRPPGHHAEHARAMGFCLFNNIAVGAHYLLKKYNIKRVLIVDWDIHHGNGTQNAFYGSDKVLYFSTHQYPYYPGSGACEETGENEGMGYTVNVPLSGGQGDADYIKIFNEVLQPIVEEYKPEFILVSAGYDIYHLDPLGTMNVTPQGFFIMTQLLKMLAEKCCDGRLLFVLEGGYNVQGIAESVKYTLFALSDYNNAAHAGQFSSSIKNISSYTQSIIQKVKKIHSANWSVFT